jgi:hypothetical protein
LDHVCNSVNRSWSAECVFQFHLYSPWRRDAAISSIMRAVRLLSAY